MHNRSSKKVANSLVSPSFVEANTKAIDQDITASVDSSDMITQAQAPSSAPAATDSEVARELAKMTKLIKDTSEALDKKLVLISLTKTMTKYIHQQPFFP